MAYHRDHRRPCSFIHLHNIIFNSVDKPFFHLGTATSAIWKIT